MISGLSRSAAACSAATSFDGQKGIIVLAEAYLSTVEFLLDEAVAVEVIGGPEGKNEATRITMGPRTSSRM